MIDDSLSEMSFYTDSRPIMTSDAEFKMDMQALRTRKNKKDDLGTLLRILTDFNSGEEEKVSKRKK